MSHHQDAETLMGMADQSALTALDHAAKSEDPLVALPGLAGAFLHLLSAQVHATLAVADALQQIRLELERTR